MFNTTFFTKEVLKLMHFFDVVILYDVTNWYLRTIY